MADFVMKHRDHVVDVSALIVALIGSYLCQRFIFWLRQEAAR